MKTPRYTEDELFLVRNRCGQLLPSLDESELADLQVGEAVCFRLVSGETFAGTLSAVMPFQFQGNAAVIHSMEIADIEEFTY